MSHKPARPSISVFFPAYNDARSIGKLIEDALDVLPELTDRYEVIVVNDGSVDETGEVLAEIASKHDAVRIVEHEINRGYGGALQSGFRTATGDLVFYTDGDAQYDVREIQKLYPLLTEKVDVVNGYKLERTDKMNRKLIGGFYNQLAHFLFALPVRDVDCDFRLIRRSFLGKITLHSTSGSICVELVYKLRKAGAIFEETGVNHYARQHGKSQFFTVRRVSKTLIDFFILWLKLVVLRRN
ncbi:MAG TPA: glycosyltransferase family 2 protein [Pyrinomonadaceae bacterium]